MYYPDICLEGLRKAVIIFSLDNPYYGRDFNPELPEYKAGAIFDGAAGLLFFHLFCYTV
jgi:hypothetical protein